MSPKVNSKTGEVIERKLTPFTVKKLMMQKGIWSMHIVLKDVLDEIVRAYNLTLELNEEPLLEKIEDLSKKIQELKKEESLLTNDDRQDIAELEKDKKERTNELTRLRKVCHPINCEMAYVQQTQNEYAETKIVFMIPYTVVNELNAQWQNLGVYGIAMQEFKAKPNV